MARYVDPEKLKKMEKAAEAKKKAAAEEEGQPQQRRKSGRSGYVLSGKGGNPSRMGAAAIKRRPLVRLSKSRPRVSDMSDIPDATTVRRRFGLSRRKRSR